ncbi:hypothetical protein PHSY_007078 [Pseudozyma hubeiensis SY62]|uniref:Uncharacterized protein n=1 Tax=Pseudozyma hubeiensis (strain SY62) TaxID=1305764 RepID=R9PDP5_PSEHS|nr:hypothetical protein PHSY_007078 [Pseudozyma hubeiensis SY62]GAC99476.1 hypothetical protein PHSY_007078 [Pseudozyma hubeiensis SY62]
MSKDGKLVDDEKTGIEEAFYAVAEASFFATTKAGADGRLDALIPASVGEGVDGRLDAGLGLFCVEERLQF